MVSSRYEARRRPSSKLIKATVRKYKLRRQVLGLKFKGSNPVNDIFITLPAASKSNDVYYAMCMMIITIFLLGHI